MARSYDIVIVGGGPGGYTAAIRAAQLGFKTACVEAKHLGGICLNWGCIPTKSLLRNAELWETLKHADEFGLKFDNLRFDFAKVIKRSRDVAGRLSKGVAFLFKKYGVEHIDAYGKLHSNSIVGIYASDGSLTEELSARHIVVATGGRPRTIPGIGIDGKKVLSSTEAMIQDHVPESIVILGAGAIGVEFAYFYNTFGSKITLIEMLPNILPIEDTEISKELERNFRKAKIKMLTSSKVDSLAQTATGVAVTVSSEKGIETIEAEVAIMAVGVRGNVENFGLDQLGVALDRGFIMYDKYYRTNVPGVYAVGDVIGPPLLAHVASSEGITCVEAIAGKNPRPVDYNNVPGCTYCQPQVASVGLTERKAKELGHELKIGKFPFTANGKAIAAGHTDGFVKLIFDAKYGELLGAHIIGSEATELIAELGLARSFESTEHEIIKTIHAHPTLSEAIMEAAANAYGEAINI